MYKKSFKLLLLMLAASLLAACSHMPFWHSGPYYGDEQHPGMEVSGHGGYQTYRKADRLPPDVPRLRKRCVTDASGHKVCGYDCKVVGGHAKCAQKSNQRCVVGSSGQIKCGYDCKVSSSGRAACGKYVYDNCVTNSYGETRCGNNCRVREDGELICGK